MSSVHSKVSSTEHPPAFPSFLKHTTELFFPQAPASPSSLPSLPPTRPLPFRAPLRPVSSLNQPPVPLPPTVHSLHPSRPFPHFFPPLLLPTHSFLLSKGPPRPQPTQPHPADPSAPPPMPPPTPSRAPSYALHSPVPVQTWPWLSSRLLR